MNGHVHPYSSDFPLCKPLVEDDPEVYAIIKKEKVEEGDMVGWIRGNGGEG